MYIVFENEAQLIAALKAAKEAYTKHEQRNPGADHSDWPEWYAGHIFQNHKQPDLTR